MCRYILFQNVNKPCGFIKLPCCWGWLLSIMRGFSKVPTVESRVLRSLFPASGIGELADNWNERWATDIESRRGEKVVLAAITTN